MRTLSETVERYVELHRATGFKFTSQAYLLRQFVGDTAASGDDCIKAATVLQWAGSAPSPQTRRHRLHALRRLAQAAAVEDPRHEIPPVVNYGPPVRKYRPHIFTPTDIARLLGAAASLPPTDSLRALTYVTLFALQVTTGLRISEALALRLDDVSSAGLVIRHTKFRKSRLVPLHPTARTAIERYTAARARIAPIATTVFVSARGSALPHSTVNATFLALVRSLGLHPGPGRAGPRVHDLRHTFAVRSLEQCEGGADAVRRHMVALSTYLGHSRITHTYWYLQVTPRLLNEIARVGEAYASAGVG